MLPPGIVNVATQTENSFWQAYAGCVPLVSLTCLAVHVSDNGDMWVANDTVRKVSDYKTFVTLMLNFSTNGFHHPREYRHITLSGKVTRSCGPVGLV